MAAVATFGADRHGAGIGRGRLAYSQFSAACFRRDVPAAVDGVRIRRVTSPRVRGRRDALVVRTRPFHGLAPVL